MYSKECIKCHQIKNENEFYKGGGKGGLQVWCKKCGLKWYRIYRKTDKHLEYRRKYHQTEKCQKRRKSYYSRPEIKERQAAHLRKLRKEKEEKLRNFCRNLSHEYIRRGKIKKENCKKCGSINSEMHHFNYDSPFNIIWLCKICHEKEHRLIRRIKKPELVEQS
jgi:monoamine oxidase